MVGGLECLGFFSVEVGGIVGFYFTFRVISVGEKVDLRIV